MRDATNSEMSRSGSQLADMAENLRQARIIAGSSLRNPQLE
jgi:hypothetical protein